MNWIDIFIITVFISYIYLDSRLGFLRLFSNLMGLFITFIIALIYYLPLSKLIALKFSLAASSSEWISFLFIWLVLQLIFFGLSKIVSYYTPEKIKKSKANRYLAFVLSGLKASIFIIIIMILASDIMMSKGQNSALQKSLIANSTVRYANGFEGVLKKAFGNTPPQISGQDETIDLGFSTSEMMVDEAAEKIIFNKVNQERIAVGVKPLIIDNSIREAARAHSQDMFQNGYFSHVSKDGQTLLDHLVRAKVNFTSGAENIATAPTPELVHFGLMNSEKHKKNILDPSFSRVGIGVMNAGSYGLMVTQDFAN